MKQTRVAITQFALVAILIGGCFSNWAIAQPVPTGFVDIRRLPLSDGSVNYDMDVSDSSFSVFHLPDGTTFSGGLPPLFFTDASYGSFAELKAAIVGTWTIERPAMPAPFNIPRIAFTFDFADFPESLFFTPPEITFPTDGSTVPPVFTMTWEWPAGVTPPVGRSTLLRRFGPGSARGGSNSSRYPSADLSKLLDLHAGSGAIPDEAMLWAGDYDPNVLAPYIGEPVIVEGTPFDVEVQVSLRSMSRPVHVLVGNVPECSSIVLIVVGASGVIGSWRRRIGQRS